MIDASQSAAIANYCREIASECDGTEYPAYVAARLTALADAIDNHNRVISGIDIIRAVRRQFP